MTATEQFQSPGSSQGEGARLYRFTVDEYHAMSDAGLFHEDDPIELLEGLLTIKSDVVPPYGVPVGIPPQEIWPEAAEWGTHPSDGSLFPNMNESLTEAF